MLAIHELDALAVALVTAEMNAEADLMVSLIMATNDEDPIDVMRLVGRLAALCGYLVAGTAVVLDMEPVELIQQYAAALAAAQPPQPQAGE